MPYFLVRPWSSTPHPGTRQPHEGCFPPSLRRPGAVSGLWRYHCPLASLHGHTLWRHGASVIPLCQACCGEGRKHEISEEEEEAGHPGVREALTCQNKSPSFRTRRSCPAPTVEPPRSPALQAALRPRPSLLLWPPVMSSYNLVLTRLWAAVPFSSLLSPS